MIRRVFILAFVIVTIVAVLFLVNATASDQNLRSPAKFKASAERFMRHDVSIPLRDIKPEIAFRTGNRLPGAQDRASLTTGDVRPNAASFLFPGANTGTLHQNDPVVQSDQGILAMPSTITNFDGISNQDNINMTGISHVPADPNGDVGKDHYIQAVNELFEVFEKDGTSVYGPARFKTFFKGFGGPCENQIDGDPIIIYDDSADRWLFTSPVWDEPDNYHQCIAISATDNPLGVWYRYDLFISDTLFNDYPKLGVWSDGYYMTFLQFIGGGSGTFAGIGTWVLERDKMIQGQDARAVYYDISEAAHVALPADADGLLPPGDESGYVAIIQADEWGYASDRIQLIQYDVNWGGESTIKDVTLIETASFDPNNCEYQRDCIPQPGVSSDAYLDARNGLMYRLQYRNFGSYDAMVVNQSVDTDGNDHIGVRWHELRRTGGSSWDIFQEGTYAPDSDHRWTGSAAMDGSGNIAVGYSVSSAVTYPSIRYAGRLSTDPLGQLSQGESTLKAGAGSQTDTDSRWGDYTSMTVDPVDSCTFWYTNQYYSQTSELKWKTRIGSFKFPECESTGPVTVEETDPSITYTGTWYPYSCASCSEGAVKYTGKTNSKASFDFEGTSIEWMAAKAKMLGKAKVYVDGTYQGLIDLYRSTPTYGVSVFEKTGLSAGNHNIRIEYSGQKNSRATGYNVDIDAFVVGQ